MRTDSFDVVVCVELSVCCQQAVEAREAKLLEEKEFLRSLNDTLIANQKVGHLVHNCWLFVSWPCVHGHAFRIAHSIVFGTL
jgi:hypothetical protein